MRKLLLIGLLIFFGCKKDKEMSINSSCSSVPTVSDTLYVDNYKLYLTCILNDKIGGSLEIIDGNGNNIRESAGFSFSLVQFKNGNDCWEGRNVKEMKGQDDTFVSVFSGYPSKFNNAQTTAIVKFKIYEKEYYLNDLKVY
ncbi:hypothetical protein MYP_1204 [Sporocytophaga myxococcoides]|uniref:Lipoprotein n=1 Tax=Sporocytophaga myxococcoides TaxID=153721 RepID=A0A098LAJ9_9BACT|nr:hypothetical protein [Sporocytophaga myxococcoides]GAL83976.1 hypothetical protein MYP_1204 [Sporocytophaga myxococcoides]